MEFKGRFFWNNIEAGIHDVLLAESFHRNLLALPIWTWVRSRCCCLHRKWAHVWQLETILPRVICSKTIFFDFACNSKKIWKDMFYLARSFIQFLYRAQTNKDLGSGMGGVCSWVWFIGFPVSLRWPIGCRYRIFQSICLTIQNSISAVWNVI